MKIFQKQKECFYANYYPPPGKLVSTIAIIAMGVSYSYGAVINVPNDYTTIAAAITAAGTDDVIEISTGTYNEYNLQLKSDITIQSVTDDAADVTIQRLTTDPEGRIFYTDANGVEDVIIKAITIKGGLSTTLMGGGVYLANSDDVSFVHVVIEDNKALHGGGILAMNTNLYIEDCLFNENVTTGST